MQLVTFIRDLEKTPLNGEPCADAPHGIQQWDEEALLERLRDLVLQARQISADTHEADEALIARAREKYALRSDDNIEIDDHAFTSESDEGIWVQAWVYVPQVGEDGG